MKWETVSIITSAGIEDAMAPVIVSASRSTDIPAFYGEWFMKRLSSGYVRWINPFNRASHLVAFEKARAVIFWSKNPAPMIPFLDELDRFDLAYYFQFTINDYQAENLEPNVPSLSKRIETFKIISRRLGAHRVIWRFDPLLLTDTISVEMLLDRIQSIGRELLPFTRKFVFSFADIDMYAKVRRNLHRADVKWRRFTDSEIQSLASGIAALCREYNVQPATCGEELDLSEHDIIHNRCIDPELLANLTRDESFRRFLGYETTMFGIQQVTDPQKLKDRGQRVACGCVVSKDIGQYDTCPHLCTYCYANTSGKTVLKNYAHTDPGSEMVVGV